jgi:gamma-glutamyltranspeptidase/glutathione hydrolase
MVLESAVMSPRLHVESGFLHMEQGLEKKAVLKLTENYPENRCWDRKSLFFGGTHVSEKKGDKFKAVGDPRRGGVSILPR